MALDQFPSNAKTRLMHFTDAHGPSGFETEIADLLDSFLGNWGDFSSDNNGCVAYSRGEGTHVMIAAHMDEVGFRVQSITKDGFIKFVPVGGWWGHTLLAQRVNIKTKSGKVITGIIGSKPVHFLPDSERSKVQTLDKMFIDIGMDSKEEVLELGVSLGDPIAPDSLFTPMAKDGRFVAKAFDNRVGCAAVSQISELLPKGTMQGKVSLAATVQEEVGLRGAKTLANLLKPDFAIILEGTPADDTLGFDRSESQALLGSGVQIRMHDPSAIMSPKLVELAEATAEKYSIPYQMAVRTSGGTDAGTFAYANEGIPSIVLGVPSRYIHTHNSMIEINDYLAMVVLAAHMSKQLTSE